MCLLCCCIIISYHGFKCNCFRRNQKVKAQEDWFNIWQWLLKWNAELCCQRNCLDSEQIPFWLRVLWQKWGPLWLFLNYIWKHLLCRSCLKMNFKIYRGLNSDAHLECCSPNAKAVSRESSSFKVLVCLSWRLLKKLWVLVWFTAALGQAEAAGTLWDEVKSEGNNAWYATGHKKAEWGEIGTSFMYCILAIITTQPCITFTPCVENNTLCSPMQMELQKNEGCMHMALNICSEVISEHWDWLGWSLLVWFTRYAVTGDSLMVGACVNIS